MVHNMEVEMVADIMAIIFSDFYSVRLTVSVSLSPHKVLR